MDSIWHHALGPQGFTAGVLHAFNGKLRYLIHRYTATDIFPQAGMGRFYELRIYIGYGLVFVSYLVVVFNLFFGCRPFHRNWQINPDPGGMYRLDRCGLSAATANDERLDVCQPAVSGQVVWVYFSFNVITDMYLLSIPLPMLWKSSLRPVKKVGLMILFGGGILVIACATLRCVLIVTVRQHHSFSCFITNDPLI
jgi:hypothetical protein